MPNAKDRSPQVQLRQDIATQDAYELILLADERLADGDLEGAEQALSEATGLAYAREDREAVDLLAAIRRATDTTRMTNALIALDDSEFQSLRETSTLPSSLTSSNALVDDAATAAAVEVLEDSIDQVLAEREARAEAERAARAAEEERKRQEARRAREAAERELAARAEAAEKARLEAERKHQEREARNARDKISAWTMTQEYVRKQLKSPSSADFGSIFGDYQDPDEQVTDLGGGTFRVRGWVDAQNAFGATIRTHFRAKIRYVGDERWRVTEFAFTR